MKGIILAGGAGSRLNPITLGVSKQLLPVYDKPMIYYPLSAFMLADDSDIRNYNHAGRCFWLATLRGGKNLANISYEEQPRPDGLAQAFNWRRLYWR